MSRLKAPSIDPRRARDFERELVERAAVWMPGWDAEASRDFGRALAKIAARFDSEVAERLDRVGDKMRRGFLDWLAVRGQAARPARMPVVFQMAAGTPAPVLARAPIRMQAEVAGASVAFESETDVRVVPGRLVSVVAVDAAEDHLYFPPPGLTTIEPPEVAPDRWTITSFAAPRSPTLQVDPPEGIAVDMVLEIEGAQYRVAKVVNGLVTIDPPVPAGAGFAEQTEVRKVMTFAPFEKTARDRQEHALYVGDPDLLNLDAGAVIDVVGAGRLGTGYAWEYWGKDKSKDSEIVTWQPLEVVDDPAPPVGTVRLKKGEGAIEPHTVGSVEGARWIRAVARAQVATPFVEEALQLRINCVESDATPATDVQAMANTTVLPERTFFPLGREPRLFDAFYLASSEAFSKKDATVTLQFEISDPAVTSYASVEFDDTTTVLAGVGRNQALSLLKFDEVTRKLSPFRERTLLQPPVPGFDGASSPSGPMRLDQTPWTPPAWGAPNQDFFVATVAGSEVWVWHENANDEKRSGWVPFDRVPALDSKSKITGLVHLGTSGPLVALRDGQFAIRDLSPSGTWKSYSTQGLPSGVTLASIVPVLEQSSQVGSVAAGVTGVGSDGKVYLVSFDHSPQAPKAKCEATVLAGIDVDVQPVAIAPSSLERIVVFFRAETIADPPALVSFSALGATHDAKNLPRGSKIVGSMLRAVTDTNRIQVLAALATVEGPKLVTYAPLEAGRLGELFFSDLPGTNTEVGGAPTVMRQHIVVPGARGDTLVASLRWADRLSLSTVAVAAGVVVPTLAPIATGDLASVDGSGRVYNVGAPEPSLVTSDSLQPLAPPIVGVVVVPNDPVRAYTAAPQFTNAPTMEIMAPGGPTTVALTLDANDIQHQLTTVGAVIVIQDRLYLVRDVSGGFATVSPYGSDPYATPPATVSYWLPQAATARAASFVRLGSGNSLPSAALLDYASLYFSHATQVRSRGRAFTIVGNSPTIVEIVGGTQIPPTVASATMTVDAAIGNWLRLAGDTSSNPALAWEYWDGSSWAHLSLDKDETQHLKSSGNVVFHVPPDLIKGEWGGKEDSWIRARLIGGDYGREVVSVTTSKPDGEGNTTQTYGRSTEGIRAPIVQQLRVTYEVCKEVTPKFLVTQDSGSFRDQSDANQTAGALVDAFLPIGTWLARLGAPAGTTTAVADGDGDECCEDDCTCGCEIAAASPVAARDAAPAPRATGRSIFLGFDANLSGETVNVLLQTAREREHGDAAPLMVEALAGSRLVPLNVQDDTRGLGESGILTLSLPDPPQRTALFGQPPLCWIRLAPARGDSDWKPSLRGAYLNAVWASATETMTFELLGSSEGAPNLELRLARPPLLEGRLELRVREPLGEEELEALSRDRPDRVRSDVPDLPGHWVLWDRVVDPGDEEATKRVYAVDEATGRVKFGDGRHGMIPPIGRDAIVAFRYQRTEPPVPGASDVPANAVPARAQINLVTPVAGVEAAFSADPAAGGAPQEPAERVLRFGSTRTRHRGRAVTMRDLEDLTLASSPEFVQARVLRRGRGLTLVVVRRGADPAPSAVQKRELKRQLLRQAPAALPPASLTIDGPAQRKLRIALTLGVATLDDAAVVAEGAKSAIQALLDPAADDTRDGWQLGVSPSADDVAFALLDLPRLVNVEAIKLFEIVDGKPQPWPATLASHELARLATDGIRFEFRDTEVAA